jgi:Bacterial low temperature requirement A protein (LtrA)
VTEPGQAGSGSAPGSGDGSAGPPLRVSTLELFFDLVFVFAITQLTGTLSRDATVPGGLRVLLIFGALRGRAVPGRVGSGRDGECGGRDGTAHRDRGGVTGRAGDADGRGGGR